MGDAGADHHHLLDAALRVSSTPDILLRTPSQSRPMCPFRPHTHLPRPDFSHATPAPPPRPAVASQVPLRRAVDVHSAGAPVDDHRHRADDRDRDMTP